MIWLAEHVEGIITIIITVAALWAAGATALESDTPTNPAHMEEDITSDIQYLSGKETATRELDEDLG